MRVAIVLSLLVSAATTLSGQTDALRSLWTAESLKKAIGRTVATDTCAPDGAARFDGSELNLERTDQEDDTLRRFSRGVTLELAGHPLHVVGGLVPSANIAAQAGGLDPVQAALAAAGGAAGPGAAQPLHLRVESNRRCF